MTNAQEPIGKREVAEFLQSRGVKEPDLAAALGRGSVGLSIRYAEETEMQELRGAVFAAGFAPAR